MKIFLIGMPGSGKSSLGAALARSLYLPFIDLDKCIEGSQGKQIREIFKIHDERYFRSVENAVLHEVCEKEAKFVMATGGGTPCFHDNMNFMCEQGQTVYLKVSARELNGRLKNTGHERPLLNVGGTIKSTIADLLENRSRFYEKADHICESDQLTVESLAYLFV